MIWQESVFVKEPKAFGASAAIKGGFQLGGRTQTKTYRSLDEMPPDVREQFEKAMRDAGIPNKPGALDGVDLESVVSTEHKYVYTDETTGQTHTYTSLDEMPPDVRARFERHLSG